MNSAAGAALIAGILSGVFVILGVVLGARLQSRSTDREHERAAAAQRDEILAALSAAGATLLTQVTLWRAIAARRKDPISGYLAEVIGKPPDPRATQIAGELERLRNAVIPLINEITLLTGRLSFSDPVLRPQAERLAVAVHMLVTDVGGPEDRFQRDYDEIVNASRALRRQRDELAELDRPQGWRVRRRQRSEGQRSHQAAGHADDDPPDGKTPAS